MISDIEAAETVLPAMKIGQHRDEWYRNVCAKVNARVGSGRWQKHFARQVIDRAQIRVSNDYANELESTAVSSLDFAFVQLLRTE